MCVSVYIHTYAVCMYTQRRSYRDMLYHGSHVSCAFSFSPSLGVLSIVGHDLGYTCTLQKQHARRRRSPASGWRSTVDGMTSMSQFLRGDLRNPHSGKHCVPPKFSSAEGRCAAHLRFPEMWIRQHRERAFQRKIHVNSQDPLQCIEGAEVQPDIAELAHEKGGNLARPRRSNVIPCLWAVYSLSTPKC